MMEWLFALIIMAMVCMVAVVIVQSLAWYEQYAARWHHEAMLESYADGWDAAAATLKAQTEEEQQ